MSDVTFTTFRGLKLKAKRWGSDTHYAHRILALHGWLDNAATWDMLLPILTNERPGQFYVVALDLAGHGLSDHRSNDADYLTHQYLEDVVAVIDGLGWSKFSLLGHSMGGGITTLAAGIFGPRVAACVAIEALGPVSRPVTALQRCVDAIEQRKDLAKRRVSNLSRFTSVEEAVSVRMKTGLHYISEPGMSIVVGRGTTKSPDGNGVIWSTDPVLAKHSAVSYTEDDVYSFLAAIKCPVLNIYGDSGLYKWFTEKGLRGREIHVKKLQLVHLPGGHHLHLEPDTVNAVADRILDFFDNVLSRRKL
ncbi:Alpha/Beta hydrolase protein [Chytriomyces sp. MP71]|nr:Alpha/Beta hydrolase protein [Chytriomyces sp. MP71]